MGKVTRVLALSMIFGSTVLAQVSIESKTIAYASNNLSEDNLRIHFVDVGAGMGVLVQTPNKVVSIDGGKGRVTQYAEYVKSFIGDGSVIDIGIITHADYDHFWGMNKLIDNHEIQEIWYNGYMSPEIHFENVSWNKFLVNIKDEVKDDKKEHFVLDDRFDVGDVFTLDDMGTNSTADDITFTFLNLDSNPPTISHEANKTFKESERRNNASLVFKISYGNTSFLITGDINGYHEDSSEEGHIYSKELELYNRHNADTKFSLEATVLQSPHHGSHHSNSTPFLEAVDPDYILVSAGNEYGHPHEDAFERMKEVVAEDQILRTDFGEDPGKNTTEPSGDDNIIFEVDLNGIINIYTVK